MTERATLERIACDWISLWNPPVDWQLFDSLHAQDFEDLTSAGRAGTKEGFAAGLKEMTNAFPDLRTRIDGLAIDTEQSRIAVRWSSTGTNKVRFLGIGPTDKATKIAGIEIIDVSEGRVIRRWGEWDISSHVNNEWFVYGLRGK